MNACHLTPSLFFLLHKSYVLASLGVGEAWVDDDSPVSGSDEVSRTN